MNRIPAAIKYPGEIAGAVGGAIATSPVTAPLAAASGLTKLPGIVKAIGSGAVGGALFGAGKADPGEELKGAAEGAPVGAIAGAAMVPLAAAGSRVFGAVRNAFSPQANVAADLSRAITRDEITPAALLAKAQEADTGDFSGRAWQRSRMPVVRMCAAWSSALPRRLVRGGRSRARLDRSSARPNTGRIAADLRGLTGTQQTATQAISETMEKRAQNPIRFTKRRLISMHGPFRRSSRLGLRSRRPGGADRS